MSSIGWLMKEYAETRDGRIAWDNHIAMRPGTEGKRKRLQRRTRAGMVPWGDLTTERGDAYTLFHGRSAKCNNIEMWSPKLVVLGGAKSRPYCEVPAKDCKACEFHEPAPKYGRRRYARCRWFRENSGMDHPLALWAKAVSDAREIIG